MCILLLYKRHTTLSTKAVETTIIQDRQYAEGPSASLGRPCFSSSGKAKDPNVTLWVDHGGCLVHVESLSSSSAESCQGRITSSNDLDSDASSCDQGKWPSFAGKTCATLRIAFAIATFPNCCRISSRHKGVWVWVAAHIHL